MAARRFNKDEFLAAEYAEALDTERTLFPIGECVAQNIEEVTVLDPKSFTDDKTGETREGSPQLELKFLINEEHSNRVRQLLDYPADKPVYFRIRLYLDINEETGWLEFGPNKNIDLGKIRAAVGQNEPGVPWGLMNLKGAGPVAFVVSHEDWERNGKKGTNERARNWASAI